MSPEFPVALIQSRLALPHFLLKHDQCLQFPIQIFSAHKAATAERCKANAEKVIYIGSYYFQGVHKRPRNNIIRTA